MKKGLIVFAREPVPGRVKTRLAAAVGDISAAGLYEAMLQDVLNASRELSEVETVVFWSCEEESLPLLARRYGFRSRKQSDGDLGSRMQSAFAEMFVSGYDVCCIIGSDAPDLPLAYIRGAFVCLAAKQADAVLGPSSDGGYYLLGMSRLLPQFFVNIEWSSPQVLRQSLAAAEKEEYRTVLLPVWHDIDTLEDLEMYQARKMNQKLTGAL